MRPPFSLTLLAIGALSLVASGVVSPALAGTDEPVKSAETAEVLDSSFACQSKLAPLKDKTCNGGDLKSICSFTGVGCGWEPDFPNLPPVQEKQAGWIYIYTIPDGEGYLQCPYCPIDQWTVMVDTQAPLDGMHIVASLPATCPLPACLSGPTESYDFSAQVGSVTLLSYIEANALHLEIAPASG